MLRSLQAFWDAGIERVSPGALGMFVRGMPFNEPEIASVIEIAPGIHYEPGVGPRWDHGWIVKDSASKEPCLR